MSLIYLFGYFLPLEWVIGLGVGFIVLLAMLLLMVLLYLRKGDTSPDNENLAAIISVDEHNTIQEGLLVGGVERSEDELYVNNPEWTEKDKDEQNGSIIDITQKVPFPLRDGFGKRKTLWILRDKGHIDCVSASTIVSEKIPKRWDLPLINWPRIFRHLEGARGVGSISNLLSSKQGILAVTGFIMVGMLAGFFLTTISGHLH